LQQFKLIPLLFMLIGSFVAKDTLAQQPDALVKTAEVVSIQMSPLRNIAAYAKAKFVTTIKAESSGRVVELALVGQSLKAGEALGLIADDVYALRLNELKGAIASQQAQADYLISESSRLKALKEQNLTSGTALDKNKADLKAAQADLAQANSRYAQLKNNMSKLTPISPYNAFVTKQLSQPGQYLNQGQDLLEIMSSDEIEIIAQLPFKLKNVIVPGDEWQYIDQVGNTASALVERFVPAATSNSRMIQVHLKNTTGQLLPGEPVQLLVPESLPQTVTAVPRDALVLRRQGSHVFVIRNGIAHKVDVTTGLAQGSLIAVFGEISPGDLVVIRGNERLRDQQPSQLIRD